MILNGTIYPFREEFYNKDLATKQSALSAVSREGCFTGRDRQLIHYRILRQEKPQAAMVICHDGGESALRYAEWEAFFFDLGYQVYSFDFRGHGGSSRTIANRSVTHIDSFDDYATDLSDLTSRIDRKLPLYITAFGMGGAVALRYLQKNPHRVQAACLVAPLLSVVLPSPRGLFRIRLSRDVKKGLSKELLQGSDCYQPGEVFSGSGWYSFARFAWYREARASDSRLQNTAYTMGWLRAALNASDQFFTARTKKITTRVLLIEAGEDRIVPSETYGRLLKRLQNGNYLRLSEASHRIQNADEKTLCDLMSLLVTYFKLPDAPAPQRRGKANDT